MITLVPYAGLANRIRCVCSVHKFCIDNKIPFRLSWPLESGFNASFSSLFRTDNLDFDVNDSGILNKIYYLTPNHEMSLCKLNSCLGFCNLHTKLLPPEMITTQNKSYASIEELDLSKDHTIVSYSILYDRTPVNDLFQPIESVRNIIKGLTDTFSPNTVGMHIRRTDHNIAISSSPVEIFDNKINELIKTDGDLKVFLCTDDIMVKNQLCQKYGRRIITYDSVLKRDSYEGIRDAVVELWTLACTREIYGSHGSSFSKMAANIYGKKYFEIKK